MQLRLPLMTISAAAALGLAACGGSDSSAEKDITGVLKRALVNRNAKMTCEEVTTKGFIQRAYGDLAQCHKAEKPDPSDHPPTDVRVSDVKVNGDRATASVREEGGDTDGAKGTFELRKEGGDWRIDDLGVDFLRSQVETGLGKGNQDTVFKDPEVRQCTRKALTDLPDPALKRVAYASISERSGSSQELTRLITPCLSVAGSGSGSGSASLLREKFEEGIARGLRKDGASKSAIACINRQLRPSISEKEIQQTATSGGNTDPKLTRKVSVAITACRAR